VQNDGSVSCGLPAVVSFDVEEHHLIEAASSLTIDADQVAHDRGRLEPVTGWLLDELDRLGIRATFFVVGQIAEHTPALVRRIHRAGHEIASHSWNHRRVHRHTPASFRDDLRRSVDALSQVTGAAVLGYRAPTFSIMASTAWALDILADEGLLYDSSIYPVRHDRYGVPQAPRVPFLARGHDRSILELPPATLTLGRRGMNLPVGGGGYFRLLPLPILKRALRRSARQDDGRRVTMTYFHPWEFDPQQRRLPLGRLSRCRTYVGISRSRDRLGRLLADQKAAGLEFAPACDVARLLLQPDHRKELPEFSPVNTSRDDSPCSIDARRLAR
jgi:polysaccharide deacetylase family protein (PEP-CTERM system associated)